MEIGLTSTEMGDAVYWRSRAQEVRETARRMISSGPRKGMLMIAGVYEKLAAGAELDQLPPGRPQRPRPPAGA